MEHKHNGGFVVSPERIGIIESEIEELFERIENLNSLLEKLLNLRKETEQKLEVLTLVLEHKDAERRRNDP